MYVPTNELSPAIRAVLVNVQYGASDIEIIGAESVDGTVAGGDGMRGFTVIVNVDTGQYKRVMGSWGGSNPWSDSPVDGTEAMIEIPTNGVVIKGTVGHPRTFARIYANPAAMGNLLPSGEQEETLTDAEQQAIYCFAAIKGGEYRRDEMRRRGVTSDTVDSLVERGYLKRNKAGATQITTRGKNARKISS